MHKKALAVVGLSSAAFAGSAFAAIDVTSVTTALTDVAAAVGTVGAAMLVVYVGMKSWKMIRQAL